MSRRLGGFSGASLAAAALALTVSTLALSLAFYAPTPTPLSPYNTGAGGSSGLVGLLGASVFRVSEGVPGGAGTVIVLAAGPLEGEAVDRYLGFVEAGGVLVVFDEEGYSNPLLSRAAPGASVTGVGVLDEVYKYGDRGEIRARHGLAGGGYLHLDGASAVEAGGADVVAWSSTFSYLDLDGDGYYSPGEPLGRQPVAIRVGYGEGAIYVVGDLDVASNRLVGDAGNPVFLRSLVRGRVYLDLDAVGPSRLDLAKYWLGRYAGPGRMRLLHAGLLSVLVVVGYGYWRRAGSAGALPVLAAYMASVSLAAAWLRGDPAPLAFSGLALILYPPGLGLASLLLLSAATVYLSALGPVGVAASLPLVLAYPFLVGGVLGVDASPTGVVGPLSRRSLLFATLFLPSILVQPGSAGFFATLYTYLLGLSLYGYVRLRGVEVRLLHMPGTVVRGRPWQAVFTVYSRVRVRVLVEVNREPAVSVDAGPGPRRVGVPLVFRRLGPADTSFAVYVVDPWGFSSRLAYAGLRRVNVAPLTELVARRVLTVVRELFPEIRAPGLAYYAGLLGGRGAGGAGAGGRGPGGEAGEGPLAAFLRRALGRLPGEGRGAWRWRRGEYLGVREYMPGDDVRDVHWKKSVSRRVMLVKYRGGGGGEGGGGGGVRALVVMDLMASSGEELDNIVYTGIAHLAGLAGSGGREALAVLLHPSGEAALVRGSPVEVLAFIASVFEEGLVELPYEYESVSGEPGEGLVYGLLGGTHASSGFLRAVRAVALSMTRRVAGLLEENGVEPPASFTVIHGRPSALHAAVLREVLSLAGYTPAEARPVPPERVERVLAAAGGD